MHTRNRKNRGSFLRKYLRSRIICLCVFLIVCAYYIIRCNRKSGDEDTYLINDPIQRKKLVFYKNTTAALSLYSEVRILCLVLIKKDYKRYQHIESTWGKRCNKLIMLNCTNYKSNGKFENIWPDVKTSFQYIYDNHLNDADWFLKTNDESYVIMENLRYYLYSYRSKEPSYFMYEPFEAQDRLSNESVYVLNKEALQSFIRLALKTNEKCQEQLQIAYEGTQMANCLDNAGVTAIDTRNFQGISPFLPHYFYTLDMIKHSKPKNWKVIRDRLIEICCPNYPIFYQQLSIDDMYLLDFAIYRLQIYGNTIQVHDVRAAPLIHQYIITTYPNESIHFQSHNQHS